MADIQEGPSPSGEANTEPKRIAKAKKHSSTIVHIHDRDDPHLHIEVQYAKFAGPPSKRVAPEYAKKGAQPPSTKNNSKPSSSKKRKSQHNAAAASDEEQPKPKRTKRKKSHHSAAEEPAQVHGGATGDHGDHHQGEDTLSKKKKTSHKRTAKDLRGPAGAELEQVHAAANSGVASSSKTNHSLKSSNNNTTDESVASATENAQGHNKKSLKVTRPIVKLEDMEAAPEEAAPDRPNENKRVDETNKQDRHIVFVGKHTFNSPSFPPQKKSQN